VAIWLGEWAAGNGDGLPSSELTADMEVLSALYGFRIHRYWDLDHIGPMLRTWKTAVEKKKAQHQGAVMPNNDTVRETVLREISKASGVPKPRLADTLKLRADLAISHENLVTLTQNLRTFIKQSNPSGTLLLREIDTAAVTVGNVVTLVAGRV
jgi:hypothetical protein